MNELRAIVILYHGNEIKEDDVKALANTLKYRCNTQGHISITSYEEDDVRNLILKDAQTEEPEVKDEETPEDKAIILIGTLMKNSLGEYYKTDKFVNELTEKVIEARANPNSETARAFMNALFILSQEDLVVSEKLLKKYRLDAKKLKLIKNVYNILRIS